MTPADWAPEDFVAGTQSAMQNAKGGEPSPSPGKAVP